MKRSLLLGSLFLTAGGLLLANRLGPSRVQGEDAGTPEIQLDLGILTADGSPFDGSLDVVFLQEDSASQARLGPFLVDCEAGTIRATLDIGLDHAGISLDAPVDIQLSLPSRFAGNISAAVWLDPADGALAEETFLPREVISDGAASVALDGLVLVPAPEIGSVSVVHASSDTLISIVPGDDSASRTVDLDSRGLPSFALEPGVESPIYGWTEEGQWTVRTPGGVAEVHARGARAQYTPTLLGTLQVEWPDSVFPDKTRVIAHPLETFKPLPELPLGSELDHSPDVLMRIISARHTAWSWSSGQSMIAQIEDLPPGPYVLELWGGASQASREPVYQGNVEILEGATTSLVIEP